MCYRISVFHFDVGLIVKVVVYSQKLIAYFWGIIIILDWRPVSFDIYKDCNVYLSEPGGGAEPAEWTSEAHHTASRRSVPTERSPARAIRQGVSVYWT